MDLVQSCGTLRFADHRGLSPSEGFEVKGNALSARLTHSKTIGQDKALSYRLVVISEKCYIRKQDWLSCGWRLLTTKADFQRDYLLPMPSGNLKGCVHRELRYDTAYALQRRVMEVLTTGQERVFSHGVGHYWTPHSGRNFLPSAAAALNIEKTDRDMLGAWAAQESDRYNRVAKVRIQMIQARVAATFADRITNDPLLEADALEDFSAYLRRQGMSDEVVAVYLRKMSARNFAHLPRPMGEAAVEQVGSLSPGEVQQREEDEFLIEREAAKKAEGQRKQQAWNRDRTLKLGSNPREARKNLRESFQPGFYIATSSKRRVKTLHLLGACYMIPGVDYPVYSYAGETFPSKRLFHGICMWCARADEARAATDHSSDTVTSSSTDEADHAFEVES